jgi:competence protein ComEA
LAVVIQRAIWGFLLGTGLLASAHAQSTELPPGRGRAEFQRICSGCHGTEMVAKLRMSPDQWAATVDDMVNRGAEGTDDDFELIVKYLSTNFGRPKGAASTEKINVNTADAAQLTNALGLRAADAAAIVAYRKNKGDYKDWSDLQKVTGIDQKKLESQKDRIIFSAVDDHK